MKPLLTLNKSRLSLAFIFFVALIFSGFSSKAQCFENFNVYQVYPYGQLCSPQNVTLRAEYFVDGSYVSGEFRWYTSDTDPNPVQTNTVYSDFGELTADYNLYAFNGTTAWVSFYNYNTGCESYRLPYSFSISSTPYLYQDYARKCGYDAAKVQLSSNTSGVTFQLYKLYEYYDPNWGWTQEYQYVDGNSTGYFEIFDFDIVDQDKYYAKVYQPYGCSQPSYYQLWFEIVETTSPTVSGNLTVGAGSSTTLTASGTAFNFKWYNASGTFLQNGSHFTTPTTLTPNTYTYQVRGASMDGVCLSDAAFVTVNVTLPSVTYTPLYNSTSFTKTIDLSKPVGTVAGSPGTTASGGVTYSIPVYTPPGTNGLQPSVGVAYNSQSGNGIAGFGWNIAGLSAISRTGKNMYHNGIVSPVSYTSDDAFMLDGMRLNPVSGANGANGTVYAGEVETFSKIISNTTSSSNNPDWFQLTGKDGSKMEFGNTTDSRVLTDDGQNVILWRLNKIIDINGNYIEFKYDNGFRDSRIAEINYTGNAAAGLLPYNKVKFNYETRTDGSTVYEAGASLSSKHLLKNITVEHEAVVIKTYQLNYGFDNVSSLLKEVVEKGSDGTSLNSTIFLYGDQPQNIVTTSSMALTENNLDFMAGDFDADGKTDLLASKFYYNGTNPIRYHSHYEMLKDITEGSYIYMYSYTLPAENSVKPDGTKLINFLSSDHNGDGRDDVLLINTTFNSSRNTFNKININYTGSHNSTTTGQYDYTTSPNFPAPYTGSYTYSYIHEKQNFFIPGDFDGDGNQDYILVLAKARNVPFPTFVAYDYKAFFSSPSTNEINIEIANFGFGPNTNPDFYAETIAGADMVNIFDFDGDGKMEVLVTKDYQTHVLTIKRVSATTGYSFAASVIATTNEIIKDCRLFPGDFNGDRKTDMLVRNTNGSWKLLYSTGKGFVTSTFTFNQSVTFNGTGDDHKIIVSDFNGDGKSDILHGYPNGSNSSKLSLYYNKAFGGSSSFYYEQYDYSKKLGKIVLGDFNGDGRSDFLNRYFYLDPVDFIFIKGEGKERMLAKVTDGHNITTAFEYKSLTDKETYPYFYDRAISLDDPSNKNPYNYVELPMYAVSSVTSPNGIGGVNATSFYYENALVHRAAKGFLGFKKITAKNETSGITLITENEVNTQFAVPYTVKQRSILTSTSEVLSESLLTNSFTDLSTGFNDKRYFQKLDKVISLDYLSGSGAESVNTYDAYGNITTNVSKTGSFTGTTVGATHVSTTTTVFGIRNTPVPARPDKITVVHDRNGSSAKTIVTQFTYTGAGLMATKKVFPTLAKAVTTTNTYNSLGNITQIATAATGLGTRTSTFTYDTKGRAPLTKTSGGSGVSQSETYSYDYRWAKPLSQKTSDCLTTTFEYDGFGQLKKANLPEGYSVTTSLNWDVQGQNVFYTFTDYSGGNPDVKAWFDKLGRESKKQTAGFNNQWLNVVTTYDAKGNVATGTNEYYGTETPVVTTNTYDVYNRLIQTANILSTITYAYAKQSSGKLQVTTTSAGQSSSKVSDAAGKIVSATDKGGTLDFYYDSWGNQTSTKHGNTTVVSSTYDSYGRQLTLVDKNAGTVSYEYDAFGQLKKQTDAKGTIYTMAYDDLGRISSRQGPEGATTYDYYKNPSTGCSNNNITKVIGFNGVVKDYTYNSLHRLQNEKITIDGVAHNTQFSYDTYGNLTNTTYPSGVVVNNTYDAAGGLLTVNGGNAAAPTTLFTATAVNGFGQYTGYTLGNGKTTQNTYTNGLPTRFYTAGVQDLNLVFDVAKGNLTSRRDALKSITENFAYDALNRLTTCTVNGMQQLSMTYDGTSTFSLGNIKTKTDAGSYVYKTDKIHAVAYITNPAGALTPPATISTIEQQITYTPYLKTETIAEGAYDLSYTYGPDYQRVKSVLKQNAAIIETKYYLGSYEKQVIGSTTREIHYVSGGNGLCAIIVREGNVNNFYFVYTDHLGSLLTITNVSGTVVAEQNFDAWGRNRNVANWQYTGASAVPAWLYRGYTGHEHVPQFALINMNGRMYDPVQGRMLSPDNYVPTPFGTQGYNRYAYAMNNPLVITDPDGEFIVPIIIGAAIGAFFGGIQADMRGESFFSGAWKGAIVGGVGGAMGGALAGTFSNWGMVGSGMAQGFITGTATGGLSAALNGSNVLNGVLKGGLIGGVIGGATGLINRLSLKGHDISISDGGPGDQNTGEFFASNEELDGFINQNIGNVNDIESSLRTDIFLASRNNLPSSSYTFEGNFIYNSKGTLVGGATRPKGGFFTSLKSEIYISPAIKGLYFNNVNVSQMAINHEFMHAYHLFKGLPNYNMYSERATSSYSLAYTKTYGMASLYNVYRPHIGPYPQSYDWKNLARILKLSK